MNRIGAARNTRKAAKTVSRCDGDSMRSAIKQVASAALGVTTEFWSTPT